MSASPFYVIEPIDKKYDGKRRGSLTKALAIKVLAGEASVQVTGGYGTYAVVERPYRTHLTVPASPPPITLTVPVLFTNDSGSDLETGVEKDIQRLELMAGRGRSIDGIKGPMIPAPVVGLYPFYPYGVKENFLVPPNYVTRRLDMGTKKKSDDEYNPIYVITDISWGENVIRNDDGRRVRQDADITLTQYVAVKHKTGGSDSPGTGPRKIPQKIYRVKDGDTLRSIARKQLGDVDLWVKIKRLNDLESNKIPKKVKKLKLPSHWEPDPDDA